MGITNLAALPALTEVHLYDCSGITEVGLAQLKRIQTLFLFGANITDRTLIGLQDLPALRWLVLRSDSLTDDGIGSLGSLTHLIGLSLSHCHHLGDEALAQIANIQSLETLELQGIAITDAGLDFVGRLPRLGRLEIQPCDRKMPGGLHVTDAGLMRIKGLQRLHTLSIRACPGVTDDIRNVLEEFGSLMLLQLYDTGITEDGQRQIVSSLPKTRVDFVLTPPSPLDGNATSENANDVPRDQLTVSCLGSRAPDSQTSLNGTLTVDELEDEYCISSAGTDAKYAGKLIEISGLVTAVGNDLEGDPIITLSGSDGQFKINCVLRSPRDLMKVAEGEACRLHGTYCISVIPTFVHCSVMDTGNGPIANGLENAPVSVNEDPQLPDVTLTAEQLESEIAADREETHRKYAGKVMQITGRLSRISHVLSGAMVYRMGAPLSTQYFLRMGNPWYCARPGQTITLVGRWYSAYPCLVNCEVISVTGTPNTTLTAEALGGYLESNRFRFHKWFYLKQIIVTGEVLAKANPNGDFDLDEFDITLRSTENTRIVCEMDSDEMSAAESISIGDTITITGWITKENQTDSVNLVRCLFWRGN